jgi:hypothetical protein
MLEALRERYRILVLTARSGDALKWSREWLRNNGLPFDRLAGAEEAKKSLHGVDALVDDYLGNVIEFLGNSEGPAVLVDQPWNRVGRSDLRPFEQTERLTVVDSLSDVAQALDLLLAPAGNRLETGGGERRRNEAGQQPHKATTSEDHAMSGD